MNDGMNCKQAESEPVFVTLLGQLREESKVMNDFANAIRDKTFMLQDFTSPEKCGIEDQPQRLGVVGEIYDILDTIRTNNSILNDARNGLTTLLG